MATVLVTGGSGFIAGHTILHLLSLNFRVRATTSNKRLYQQYLDQKDRKKKQIPELQYCFNHPSAIDLSLHYANLSDDNAFDQVIQGCQYVVHLAANVNAHGAKTKDLEKEFVAPTVNGSLSIFKSALKAESVKKIIYISSLFAISTNIPDQPVDASLWNEQSVLSEEPYAYSKTKAEKAVWEFQKVHQPHYDIVVICPGGVIGPHLSPKPTEVTDVIKNMMNGWNPILPRVPIPVVDVRDVSDTILSALLNPKCKNRRYLCVTHCTDAFEIGQALKKKYPTHPLPLFILPAFLFKLLPNLGDEGIAYAQRNCGKKYSFNVKSLQDDLGIQFRPSNTTIEDCVDSLIDLKQIAPSYRINPYHIFLAICTLSLLLLFLLFQ